MEKKHLDAEKLKAEIEKRLKNVRDYMNGTGMRYKGPKYFKAQGKESVYDALLSIIDSLQQEPIPDTDVLHTKLVNLLKTYRIDVETARTMADRIANTYGVQRYMDGLCDGMDKKDTKKKQPEVNLDELINDFLLNNCEFLVERDSKVVVQKLARHFYELGLNARKEN